MLDDRICVCITELSAVDMVLNYMSTQGCIEGFCIIAIYGIRCPINIPKPNQGLDESLYAHIGHKLNVNGSYIHTYKY